MFTASHNGSVYVLDRVPLFVKNFAKIRIFIQCSAIISKKKPKTALQGFETGLATGAKGDFIFKILKYAYKIVQKGEKLLKKRYLCILAQDMNKGEIIHPLHLFEFCPKCGSESFVVNDKKSKRCERCGFVYYFNPLAATVGIIKNNKGEILVATRSKEPAKGTLDLPGGFCDSHETAEEGVAREILEETGLKVTSTKYLFTIPNIYLYSGMELHTMDMFFECEVEDCNALKADDDVASLQWIRIDGLKEEMFGLRSIRESIGKFKEIYKNSTI